MQKLALGKGLASLLPAAANIPPTPPEQTTTVEAPQKTELPPQSGAVADPSLLSPPPAPAASAMANKDRIPGVTLANIEDIHVNPFQPRREFDEHALEELTQSIKENGLIQPLIVRKTSEGFQLIAGERRLRASKRAGIKHIPVVVRQSTDRESLELALIENVQRQDLNCIDEALAYFQLSQEFSLSQEEIAKKVAKDRTTISNTMRLLRLPEEIIDDLKVGALSYGHGKALLGIEDNATRLKIRAEVKERHASVRETELLVQKYKEIAQDKEMGAPNSEKPKLSDLERRMFTLAQDLTRQFSTRVDIKGSDSKGKIVLHYRSRENLERVLSLLETSRSSGQT
jgi:ParB family chromosome partitioning protein